MLIDITKKEFEAIKEVMYTKTGVFLKDTKKPLVSSRLRKRMEELGLKKFSEYIPKLKEGGTQELEILINALTTNETYFFRHTKQFNYLYEKALPFVMGKKKLGQNRVIRIWSGACSTGEEPYSLAISCREFFKEKRDWKVEIYATDVNSEVLDFAQAGKYRERSLKEVPDVLKKRYFDEGVAEKGGYATFQLKDFVRKEVKFMQHNLLKPFAQRNFDIIFLRNVLIYFDRKSKKVVVGNLENCLSPGGYLFISLAESLNDVETRLKYLETGIYQKVE